MAGRQAGRQETVNREAHLQLRQLGEQPQLLQVRSVAVIYKHAQGAQLWQQFGRQASTLTWTPTDAAR